MPRSAANANADLLPSPRRFVGKASYIVLGFDLLFGVNILAQGYRAFLYANAAVSVAFLLPAIWVFRNLNFRNACHPVIRAFINGAGGKQLLAAADFLSRIEQFKAEEQN